MNIDFGEHYGAVVCPTWIDSAVGEHGKALVFPNRAKDTIGEQTARFLFPNFISWQAMTVSPATPAWQ